MREKLVILVLSCAWKSRNERMVVKCESNKSSRVDGRLVVRGVELRSLTYIW